MRKLGSFVATALLLGTPAYAQETSEIDKISSWAAPNAPGCVVAVSQHGKPVMNRAYGSANLERDVPLSPSSIFDAGSLQKQFVAASVLLLVEAERLSLSDDVRKYVPELPDYGSDELRAVLQTVPGKDGLMILLNEAPGDGFEFRPVDRDTFQRGGMTLRFLRDKAGKVVALDYSNPVLRNITFTRLSDG